MPLLEARAVPTQERAKNWAEADRIRDELEGHAAYEVIDTPQGAVWKRI